MKVIEVEINFEDYHYVSGILELKVSGNKIQDGLSEAFDVNDVLFAKFNVEKKFISPEIPDGIKKDRVFALPLPSETSVYLPEDDSKGYKVVFDKIICDDKYVSNNGYLKVGRSNTVKDGQKVFSTIYVEAYGLKKKIRTEIEQVTFYELFESVIGPGQIEIEPKRELYSIGEKVTIKAIPNKNSRFVNWTDDFDNNSQQEITFTIEKDYKFSAVFTQVKTKSIKEVGKDALKTISSSENWGSILSPDTPSYKNRYSSRKNTHSYVDNGGCLNSIGEGISGFFLLLGYLFYGGIFIIFIVFLIQLIGWNLLYLIGFVLLIWGISKLFQIIRFGRVLGYFFNLFFLFFIGLTLYSLFNNLEFGSTGYKRTEPKPKTVEEVKENSTIDYVHHIKWEDFKDNQYETNLRVNSDFVLYEQNIKSTLPQIRSENDYNIILKRLYQESEESLYHVFKSLDSIKTNNNINLYDFPQVIVSMVQSIPYYAILDASCNPYDYRDETMRDLLLNNPCQGYVKFGLKSPSEFLKDIKGDCDSRTLFLFCILKHYNYDVAIFGSKVYKHSMLGISFENPDYNLIYKEHNGKKYYLWETTSENFNMGVIPKEINDVQYWNLNLN